MTKMMLLAIPMIALLGGCSPSLQERPTLVEAINKCPVLKTYTPEQLRKAASELKQIPNESQIAVLLSDYSKFRDACRVADRKLKAMVKKKTREDAR
jgi:hypothetical protein